VVVIIDLQTPEESDNTTFVHFKVKLCVSTLLINIQKELFETFN